MQEDKQEKIDKINRLVQEYKDGKEENAQELLAIFKPFLLKQCNKYNQLYPKVHQWANIEQEAMIIFYDLLNEYTIGGVAYFNVFITKKLPFRLRYFFIKEIKHRGKNLCHDDDQMLMHNLISDDCGINKIMENIEDSENAKMIKGLIDSDLLNNRERDMLLKNVLQGMSHEKIAEGYEISRSRVSKIISNSLKKIRKELADYAQYRGEI